MFAADKFVARALPIIREKLGGEKALVALSGGIDSSVCTALVARAIGQDLQAIFLDTGFMRKNEAEKVKKMMASAGITVTVIDVKEEFLARLEGIEDSEEKRKAFRTAFYEIFGREAKKSGCDWLVQGTIAPDWIEAKGEIKSQHNVLEQIGIDSRTRFGFRLLEPLAYLYKDQVREVGKFLGLPENVYIRQPFPGPGLLVRCIGEVHRDKLDDLREAVEIVEKEIRLSESQQYFAAVFSSKGKELESAAQQAEELLAVEKAEAILFEAKGTGVKGDVRKYGNLLGLELSKRVLVSLLADKQLDIINGHRETARVLVLVKKKEKKKYNAVIRAINTRDFMTARVTELSWEKLEKIAGEILEKCPHVGAVYYDVTPKPPATVEFE